MSASFPNAKKTFTQVVNGVTKLVAALFNSPYDEIEAIQTMLGAMGATQANTDTYKNLLVQFFAGCDVDYKSDDDIYVRAGEIAIPDASGNLRFRKNTADLTVTFADIDTGSEANSTTYYVYATADNSGTTFEVAISTSASAPSGFTFYRLIGNFYNNSAGNITKVLFTLLEQWYDYDTTDANQVGGTGAALTYNTEYQAEVAGFAMGTNRAGSGTSESQGITLYVYSVANSRSANDIVSINSNNTGNKAFSAGGIVPKGMFWYIERAGTNSVYVKFTPKK